MLVLGQDSIVGLDVVLLEHSLIAIVYQLMYSSYRVGGGEVYPRAVHHGRLVTVLCIVGVSQAIRTKDVQERVLQAEELVAVGRHDEVMCWVVMRGLWSRYAIGEMEGRRETKRPNHSRYSTPLRLDPRAPPSTLERKHGT